MVIDDILIDIKCTKGNKVISEILQLLGYSALLKFNENFNKRISEIGILNVLQGTYVTYNINNITDNGLLNYLKILSNQFTSI